ncbi:LOW QUALITY PROTEIN: MAP7 domain-containing protein 1-like, partial [Manacus vitellinus]|uniref:LOW QUALITY PROTEIN: MAP7 domain-containing protein 1-like n=1 Tax=Manacus vitellinus TaxID=328815 RepID=UPI00115E4B11
AGTCQGFGHTGQGHGGCTPSPSTRRGHSGGAGVTRVARGPVDRSLQLSPWESSIVDRLMTPTLSFLARSRSAVTLAGNGKEQVPVCPSGSASASPLSPCQTTGWPQRVGWARAEGGNPASPDVTPAPHGAEPSPKKKEKKEKDRENAKERSALSRERSLKKRQSLPAAQPRLLPAADSSPGPKNRPSSPATPKNRPSSPATPKNRPSSPATPKARPAVPQPGPSGSPHKPPLPRSAHPPQVRAKGGGRERGSKRGRRKARRGRKEERGPGAPSPSEPPKVPAEPTGSAPCQPPAPVPASPPSLEPPAGPTDREGAARLPGGEAETRPREQREREAAGTAPGARKEQERLGGLRPLGPRARSPAVLRALFPQAGAGERAARKQSRREAGHGGGMRRAAAAGGAERPQREPRREAGSKTERLAENRSG